MNKWKLQMSTSFDRPKGKSNNHLKGQMEDCGHFPTHKSIFKEEKAFCQSNVVIKVSSNLPFASSGHQKDVPDETLGFPHQSRNQGH